MQCPRCKTYIPDNGKFCIQCGKKLIREQHVKTRGNGTGSVYQLPNRKWRAVITLGYELDEAGIKHRITRSRSDFTKKKDALDYVASLKSKKTERKNITFKQLFDLWKPTHNKSQSTMNCYNAAMNYFKDIWFDNMTDIDIDDLQECLDSCPKGKRTRENMKALAGLIYKFGIPRHYTPNNLNLAEYLIVGGGSTTAKASFTEKEIELIKNGVDKIPYVDYIYAQIYLGFRPSEMLKLDIKNYNRQEKAFIGGGKTAAGTDRTVTVSPKIQSIVDRLTKDKIAGPVFCDDKGRQMSIKDYRTFFYAALDALGIENPITIIDGKEFHKYTPHTCRHTFATLMKKVQGADKDKLALIGHSSEEMLRYYQDVNYDDLRQITNAL